MEGSACQCDAAEFRVSPKATLCAAVLKDRIDTDEDGQADDENDWLDLAEEYSALALTFGRDKLPALSGAAKRSSHFKSGDVYLAGLWKSQLPRSLAWEIPRDNLKKHPEDDEWTTPSWSWASVETPFTFVYWVRNRFRYSMATGALLAHHKIESDPMDQTGRVRSGSISIACPIVHATLDSAPNPEYGDYKYLVNFEGVVVSFSADYLLYEPGKYFVPHNSPVVCALLAVDARDQSNDGSKTFLVLLPVNKDLNTYRRIGILEWQFLSLESPYLYEASSINLKGEINMITIV